MSKQIKHIFICASLLFLLAEVQAQSGEEVSGEVNDAEIVIEKERKIELGTERKIYEFIKWAPKEEQVNIGSSDFEWFTYDETGYQLSLKAASLPKSGPSKVYAHHLKAGFGNYGSPLLDIDLTRALDSDKRVGFNFRHESFARGEVDDENSGSSVTQADLYGAMVNENFRLNSSLKYSLEKNFYYGYPEGSTFSKDDIRHTSNFLNFGVGLDNLNKRDTWSYSSKLNYLHYSDNFKAKENSFLGSAAVNHSSTYFFEVEWALSSYEDSGIDESRAYLRLNPYYRLMITDLTLDLGLSVSVQNDDYPDLNTNKIFPFARAKYPLSEDYEIFGKLDGGFTFNGLYDFAQQSGVLNQSVTLANSERVMELSGGIQGKPSDQLSFVAAVEFRTIKYLPIFINNGTDQSRIDVVYDQENSKVLKLSGQTKYRIVDGHELGAGFNLYNYSSDGYDQIYHRPTSEFFMSGRHVLLPKLSANWNFSFTGGLVAPGRAATDADQSLDTITKLDLEMNYQINEQWGAFLSGENLLNQNYERYLYYPQRGVQVRAGAIFRL